MLDVTNLTASYGRTEVLHDISLTATKERPVAVLGPNGAGKTSLCRALSGTIETAADTISVDGRSLLDSDPAGRIRTGLVHVPEGRQIFPLMTVEENLRAGAFVHRRQHGRLGKVVPTVAYDMFPILFERRQQRAGHLSGGEQQMLAIGRALMSRPTVLLLDEPSHGLAPRLVAEVGQLLHRIVESRNTTVVLVEQNLSLASQVATDAFVLDSGRIVSQGPLQTVIDSDAVRTAYLG